MSVIFGILGFLVGFLLFLSGAVIGPSLPMSARSSIAQFYWGQAVGSYRRPFLTINRDNDAAIYPATFDREKEADRIVTDEEQYYQDRTHAVTRLKNKPLGLVYTEFNEVLQPPDADVAGRYYRIVDDGRDNRPFELAADGGEPQIVAAFNVFCEVEPGVNVVDVSQARPRMVESWEPNDPEKGEEDIKKSQEQYKTRDTLEMISVLVAAGAGAGLAWLMWSNTSGDSAVTVPIQLGAAALGVPA